MGFLAVFFFAINPAARVTVIRDNRAIHMGSSGTEGVGLAVGFVWAVGDEVGPVVMVSVGLAVGFAVAAGVGDAVGDVVATGELCQFQVRVESCVIANVTDVPVPEETDPVPEKPVQVQTKLPSVTGLTTL
jgi:hypothetical protein